MALVVRVGLVPSLVVGVRLAEALRRSAETGVGVLGCVASLPRDCRAHGFAGLVMASLRSMPLCLPMMIWRIQRSEQCNEGGNFLSAYQI